MMVSVHARDRWIKRFNPKANNVVEEILKEKSQAIEILQTKESPNKLMEYSVKDNMLFVVDLRRDMLVTVIDIVFGFGEEIDRELCRMQTKKILRLKEGLQEEEEIFASQVRGIEEEMLVLEAELEKAKMEVKRREDLRNKLGEEKRRYVKILATKRKEYEKEVNKLRYSINYRLEMLAQKEEKTKGEKSNGNN